MLSVSLNICVFQGALLKKMMKANLKSNFIEMNKYAFVYS